MGELPSLAAVGSFVALRVAMGHYGWGGRGFVWQSRHHPSSHRWPCCLGLSGASSILLPSSGRGQRRWQVRSGSRLRLDRRDGGYTPSLRVQAAR